MIGTAGGHGRALDDLRGGAILLVLLLPIFSQPYRLGLDELNGRLPLFIYYINTTFFSMSGSRSRWRHSGRWQLRTISTASGRCSSGSLHPAGFTAIRFALTLTRWFADIPGEDMYRLRTLGWAAAGTVCLLTMTGCSSSGTGSNAGRSVEDVMKAGFKGKDPALKGADTISGRIGAGKASEADLQLMVELTRDLARNKPPKGELASWAEKTKALKAAAMQLAAHKPGAIDAWKAAASCKACHSLHKPD